MPTFAEFRIRLEKEFDCKFNIDREPFPISYFERIVNGKKITCVVDLNSDSEPVTPTVIRSVCTRLKINLTEFNLHLG